jgi:hypothetical protein
MQSEGKRPYKHTLGAVLHQRWMVALKPRAQGSPVQTLLRAMGDGRCHD